MSIEYLLSHCALQKTFIHLQPAAQKRYLNAKKCKNLVQQTSYVNTTGKNLKTLDQSNNLSGTINRMNTFLIELVFTWYRKVIYSMQWWSKKHFWKQNGNITAAVIITSSPFNTCACIDRTLLRVIKNNLPLRSQEAIHISAFKSPRI